MARGAAFRGKRVAFGDGRKIYWDQHSEQIFRGNPNIAPPNAVASPDRLEWIPFYRGHRIYNQAGDNRWIWNYEFRPTPGEVFLAREERKFAEPLGRGFAVIEPNVPAHKSVGPNKQWPFDRYREIARRLMVAGVKVIQFNHARGYRIPGVRHIATPSFRHALAVLRRAGLYIGPEGGLHHGAAAFGIKAVVLFGGFIPPQVTGYDFHTNLTGGAEACGSWKPCDHCKAAMDRISVEEVEASVSQYQGLLAS